MKARQLTIYRGSCAVLNEMEFDIPQGKWTSIIGPNGAGKSSLLQGIAGLLKYTGSITLGDVNLKTLSGKALAKKVAWLDQSATAQEDLENSLSAYDTVMLGRLPHQSWLHIPDPLDHCKVEEVMQQTHTWSLRERPLMTLSGGERQRVLLARLLAVDANVLLMDEPLANLDPPHQADFLDWQCALMEKNATLVTVLHEIHFALRADHIIMLARGGLYFQGSSQDPETHQALITLFEGRIRLEKLGNDWIALPN